MTGSARASRNTLLANFQVTLGQPLNLNASEFLSIKGGASTVTFGCQKVPDDALRAGGGNLSSRASSAGICYMALGKSCVTLSLSLHNGSQVFVWLIPITSAFWGAGILQERETETETGRETTRYDSRPKEGRIPACEMPSRSLFIHSRGP